MKNEDKSDINNLVKKHIAQYLGVEVEDIDEEDSLIQDLHMIPTDLTDFLETLNQEGVDTTKVDMTQIETVGELIETIRND